MNNPEDVLKVLTDAERAALETLAGAGWRPMTEARIERAIIEGYDYPTYRVTGTYMFAMVLPNLEDRQTEKPKKRGPGRPKKK